MSSLRSIATLVVVWLLVGAVGCAHPTEFTGEPKIEDGAEGCETECEEQDLEFAGMVMMGEYTDGCICAEPEREQEEVVEAVPAAVSGAVGVIMQMRAQGDDHHEHQQHQQEQQQQPHQP